jgi:PAS domain S-box-containing protein
MRLSTALSIYSPENRGRLLWLAGVWVAVVAFIDWRTKPYLSLGFLYLFPIMIAAGYLSRRQIVSLAVLCSLLQELFSFLPSGDALPRLFLSSAGFIGTGLFIHELVHTRGLVLAHLKEVERQVGARREAEEQLRVLVESSPAAIVTLDAEGKILLANDAAQQLLAPEGTPLAGQRVSSFLPALHAAVLSGAGRNFRTTLQCRGQRSNGEAFLAGVWFSTYASEHGNRLAAIFVDLSEELRSREDLNLDYLLTNSRILISAVSHEVRNLCGAAMVVHRNLKQVPQLQGNADFEALGSLIQGLEQISGVELRDGGQRRSAMELHSVLDELRVLIEAPCHEAGISVRWQLAEGLPLVWADRYGLMQAFLNLCKNSIRALESVERRELTISSEVTDLQVIIRVADSGEGVASPEQLFRPFRADAKGSGLGLYVSRAVLRSFDGELAHQPAAGGCCFAVLLPRVMQVEESLHG